MAEERERELGRVTARDVEGWEVVARYGVVSRALAAIRLFLIDISRAGRARRIRSPEGAPPLLKRLFELRADAWPRSESPRRMDCASDAPLARGAKDVLKAASRTSLPTPTCS
jgi:hypothetical protein